KTSHPTATQSASNPFYPTYTHCFPHCLHPIHYKLPTLNTMARIFVIALGLGFILVGIYQELQTLNQKFENSELRLGAMEPNIQNIERRSGAMEPNIQNIERRLGAMESDIARLSIPKTMGGLSELDEVTLQSIVKEHEAHEELVRLLSIAQTMQHNLTAAHGLL
ncbi:hypothetical protein F4680DRAFT_276502, partial [Xylaria scruposa]